MTPQIASLRLLLAAIHAIDSQATYYASVSESDLFLRWERAVDASLASLLLSPEVGSLFYFDHPSLSELRRWPIPGFPNHLLVYKYDRQQNTLIVVDVPHGARDLQSRLRASVRSLPFES